MIEWHKVIIEEMRLSPQNTIEQFENYETKVKSFTQTELLSTLSDLLYREKKIGDAILVVLSEIQGRRIYAEMGYSSLFELLTKYFKLSESSSYQKISVIKLIEEVPSAKLALVNGTASVSNLVLAHHTIKEQNKVQKLSETEKNKIIDQVKNKSQRKAKDDLASLFPQQTKPDQIKVINQSQASVQCTIDKSLQEKLEHIKNLIAHKNPNPSINELLHIMADIAICHIEKKKGFESKTPEASKDDNKKVHTCRKVCVKKSEGQSEQPKKIKRTRYIKKAVKQLVFQRAGGQCQYVSPEGNRCQCKKFLELEHIVPFAKGGMNDADSLQLYCSQHNSLKAKQDFGKDPRSYKKSKRDLQI